MSPSGPQSRIENNTDEPKSDCSYHRAAPSPGHKLQDNVGFIGLIYGTVCSLPHPLLHVCCPGGGPMVLLLFTERIPGEVENMVFRLNLVLRTLGF